MLCSHVYRSTFWIDFKESKMQLKDSQPKLPNQTILLPFCTHSIGCQWQLEFSTEYPPSVTVLCQIPVLNICPGSCGFTYHRDNSVRPVTTAFFVFPPSKQKTFGQRSFSYACPVILNKLPYDIRSSQSKTSFEQALKTHLFSTHYWSEGFRPVCYTCCRLSILAWLYLQRQQRLVGPLSILPGTLSS